MELLMTNEREANKVVAKTMRIAFLMFTIVYIMNVVGIFLVDDTVMTISYILGTIMLLLPTILLKVVKNNVKYIKYLNVIFASIFVIILSITLSYHVVVLYVFGIAIASLYFSRKLNILATAISVIGVSAGQIIAFTLQTLPDRNFVELKNLLMFGVGPRAIILIAVSAIFTMLASRTTALLANLLGAEE